MTMDRAAALRALVDAVVMARSMPRSSDGSVSAADLTSLVSDLLPLPSGGLNVDQMIDYAADQLVACTVAAVELTNALLDRLCAASGGSDAAILREVLAVLEIGL